MPFGKYRGEQISEISLGYLAWLVESANLKGEIRDVVTVEIIRRVDCYAVKKKPKKNTTKATKIYRILAQKYHPDKGGTNESFRAIKEFYDLLKSDKE